MTSESAEVANSFSATVQRRAWMNLSDLTTVRIAGYGGA
jgi:hypothetical protein